MMTVVTMVPVVSLGGVDMVTDLPGDLVGDLVAHWVGDLVAHGPGHLALVVLGDLVTLPLHMLVADGGRTVAAIARLCLSLAIPGTRVAAVDDLRVMTHNSRAVVHLGVGFHALSGEGLLALLNEGCVHHSVAHGSGHLALVLLRHLVALLLHVLLALRPGAVAPVPGLGLGLPLAVVTTMTVADHMAVVTNNSGAVVHLLAGLLAVLGHNVLALLDVGRVHDGLAHGAGHLPRVLLRHLVALLLHVVVAPRARGVASVPGLSLGLGLPLAVVTSVAVAHHVAVVANNVGAVVNL